MRPQAQVGWDQGGPAAAEVLIRRLGWDGFRQGQVEERRTAKRAEEALIRCSGYPGRRATVHSSVKVKAEVRIGKPRM